MPGGQVAGGDELLPHLLERLPLARQRVLRRAADGRRHAVEVADEPAHALGHERERVVGALRRVIEREVLLDHPGAEHERDESHRDPALVIREPDDEVRIPLAIRLDDAEVQLLHRARVRGGALEQAELRVERKDRVHRPLDVLHRPPARGEEHRLAEPCDVAEKRRVHEVGGGDLEGGRPELGEEVRARLVEHGREERDAFLAAELAELEPVAGRELERVAVLAVRRAEAVLVVVRRVVERARVERLVVALLELDRVRAAAFRGPDQLLGVLDVALVVVPDLGDDVRLAVARDPLAVDDELRHADDGTSPARRAVDTGR